MTEYVFCFMPVPVHVMCLCFALLCFPYLKRPSTFLTEEILFIIHYYKKKKTYCACYPS